jgi:hypothetical protein
MPAAEENPENACDDGNEKCAHKQIGGDREGEASIADAAEIKDGYDDQNADAENNRLRQQGRNGRDQGTDARGNAHGGREDIIGEECSRGQQACRCAKVEARYGIGAAAGGIGGDGLAIGEDTITSKVMMAALMGMMYRTPRRPRGIRRLKAASGP